MMKLPFRSASLPTRPAQTEPHSVVKDPLLSHAANLIIPGMKQAEPTIRSTDRIINIQAFRIGQIRLNCHIPPID